mmetsp:Transcript_7845/g.14785  ORF Transcript_7845/g.14785 Transcript_7845/m.14785 type:complete len:439 (-) Transcript_7845:727-2043(-)
MIKTTVFMNVCMLFLLLKKSLGHGATMIDENNSYDPKLEVGNTITSGERAWLLSNSNEKPKGEAEVQSPKPSSGTKPRWHHRQPQSDNGSSKSGFVDEFVDEIQPLSERFEINRSTNIDRDTIVRINNQAHDGSIDSSYFLGLMYVYGLGFTEPDYLEGLRWFKEAAMKGHKEAQCAIGILLYSGAGDIGEDKKTAMRWFYRASVDSKDSYGYWLLGKSLYEGLTFEDIKISAKDAASPLKIDWHEWYDDIHDNASLSNILAAHLFTKAEGVYQAKHHLAVMFEYGLIPYDFWKGENDAKDNSTNDNVFVPNYRKANELYRIAALEGSIESLYNLGLMYSYGRGVPVNYSRAVDLFRRAASSQHSPSMSYLGLFAMQGLGQPNDMPNFKEAVFWFSKCAQYAPPYVKELCDYELNNIRQSIQKIETTYNSLLQRLLQG